MMFRLDWLIFGNGWGMKSPYHDDRFYWLVDTKHGRKNGSGAFYRFSFGFGAQLHSIQWTHPNAGEERELIGRKFRPFQSRRVGLRVEVSWALQGLSGGLDAERVTINRLRDDLNSVLMEPRHD